MNTCASFSLVRMSDFIASSFGLNLSKIRLASFAPRLHISQDSVGNCSRCLKAQCCQMPPLSSSISSYVGRKGSVDGRSRAKRLQLTALEGHTSVAGEPSTPCDSCNGRGWLVCDFCEGQKVNVQAKNSRIYRRCPSCRTAGVVICPRCKVFKCVSFPDDKDAGISL